MRTGILGGLLAVVLIAAVGVFGVWFFFIRGDEPAPVTLEAALEAAGDATAADRATPAGADEAAGEGVEPLQVEEPVEEPIEEFEGVWTIDATDSFVGYRVREQLSGIGATTAVGRTSTVTGSLEFDGEAITSVDLTADLRDLRSDDSRRDNQLRRQALQTDQFPEARFVLAEPIAIGEPPGEGVALSEVAVGDFTLHGVTQRIEIAVEGLIQGDAVIVVGSTEIEFADYDIDPPSAPLVLSVEDHGVMEFQLIFRRS